MCVGARARRGALFERGERRRAAERRPRGRDEDASFGVDARRAIGPSLFFFLLAACLSPHTHERTRRHPDHQAYSAL
jgi:hypothetical protein